MSQAVINNNCVIYPTELYKKYNLYLIAEYEDFLKVTASLDKHIKTVQDLKDLLEENTYTTNDKDWKLKMLNIITWEEYLVHYYDRLNTRYRYIYKDRKVSSIDIFSRKLKLEKLKNL